MFLNIENFFNITDEVIPMSYESRLDSLALCIKMRTLVVPLGQRCPEVLEKFLEKEEKIRERLLKKFKEINERYSVVKAEKMIDKVFSNWWNALYNYK